MVFSARQKGPTICPAPITPSLVTGEAELIDRRFIVGLKRHRCLTADEMRFIFRSRKSLFWVDSVVGFTRSQGIYLLRLR